MAKSVTIDDNERNIFLEYLINGIASVYRTQLSGSHYYMEKGGEIHELRNSAIEFRKDEQLFIREKNEYLGVLTILLNDSPRDLHTDNVDLKAKSLVKLAKNYHESVCDDECIIYERKNRKSSFYIGAQGGVNMNSIYLRGATHSKYSTGWMAGMKFGYDSFDWFEKLGAYIGFNYVQTYDYTFEAKTANGAFWIKYEGDTYKFRSHTIKKDYFTELDQLEAFIGIQKLVIPIVLTYRLSNRKFQPYVGLGLVNEFNLSQNSDFQFEHTYQEFGQSIPNYGIGVSGQLGVNYKLSDRSRLNFETGWRYASNLNVNRFLRIDQYSIPITLGYSVIL